LDYVSRALANSKKQDYDKALEDFGKALRPNPSNAAIYYQRAMVFRGMGREAEARADIRKYDEQSRQEKGVK
jgi:tetratricopeptide (TPR) repeat protein